MDFDSVYKFGKKHLAEHFFCKICGVYTHHIRRRDPNQISINGVGLLKSFSRSFKYFCNIFQHFMIHLISDEVWLRARIHLKLKGIGAKCSDWLLQ